MKTCEIARNFLFLEKLNFVRESPLEKITLRQLMKIYDENADNVIDCRLLVTADAINGWSGVIHTNAPIHSHVIMKMLYVQRQSEAPIINFTLYQWKFTWSSFLMAKYKTTKLGGWISSFRMSHDTKQCTWIQYNEAWIFPFQHEIALITQTINTFHSLPNGTNGESFDFWSNLLTWPSDSYSLNADWFDILTSWFFFLLHKKLSQFSSEWSFIFFVENIPLTLI